MDAVRTPVTVLLPIGHDDTDFASLSFDRMLPTVHWAAVQDHHIR
jgi:hypothetical protein